MNTSQALQLGFQHLNSGNWSIAGQLFEEVLRQEPQNFAALNGRGFIALQQHRLSQSAVDFRQSLAINPRQPFAYKMLGVVLGAMGQFESSMQAFARALMLDAKDPEVYFNRANFRFQAGKPQEALADLDEAIKLRASYLEARSNRANLLIQLGDFARAEKDLDYLVGELTNSSDLWVALGFAKHKVGKQREALQCNEEALKLAPNHPDALLNSSSATYDQGDYLSALSWAEKSIAAAPNRAETYYARAQALMALSRFEDAVQSYSRAIELNPNYAEAWMGRGLTKSWLRDLYGAVEDCEMAVSLRPNGSVEINNLGGLLVKRGDCLKAIECFTKAQLIDPLNTLALENQARALAILKRFEQAKDCYKRAILVDPNIRWAHGELLFIFASTCEWDPFERLYLESLPRLRAGEPVCKPFEILATPADLKTRKICAESYSQNKYVSADLGEEIKRTNLFREKLTIAYLSSDFYNHATSYLIAELFELHDRERFNVIGVCYGASPHDEMRSRISKSFDQFIEGSGMSDQHLAESLKKIGVDIAIDLKGHTKDSRLGILAERVAPVQIHYLGYPGTLGAKFIDYLIADETLIPESHKAFYTEKIIYMPHTYQVNDRLKKISEKFDTRTDHGLPVDKFVFCSFNNNWKITPDVFDLWMRLLKKLEGSVLWLLEDNEEASKNLMREAAKRGVYSDRIVFAKRAPLADHLARHRHADLFLDTFCCNAHTTASDALWAGLPLITLLGNNFASRVSASLLKAIDLDELVVDSADAYESLALELAENAQKLAAIRQKLSSNKLVAPLFDTPKFTKNLENAYEAVWARQEAGLRPDHIRVFA